MNLSFTLAAFFVATLALVAGTVELRPCAAEDDTWCYWDAQTRGNGQGQSFIAFGGRE